MALQETNLVPSDPLNRLSDELREQLIFDHLSIVKLIAREVHESLPASVALDDLVSAGIVGLVAAVDGYRQDNGVAFETYASHKVRGTILNRLSRMASLKHDKRTKPIQAAIPDLSASVSAPPLRQGSDRSNSGPDVRTLLEDPTVGVLMGAAAAFQNLEAGRLWLFTPSAALGNVTPMSLVSTAAGREIVANELGLIEHGMF